MSEQTHTAGRGMLGRTRIKSCSQGKEAGFEHNTEDTSELVCAWGMCARVCTSTVCFRDCHDFK